MTWLSQEAALLKAGAGKCVCSETEGRVLGIENYVEQREVEILEKDDFNCAIEASIEDNEEIVVNASKPLADGMQVR